MERAFTTTTQGPVALRLPVGTARVTVDPAVKAAAIRLHTSDADGPAVDAINGAIARTTDGLAVDVPEIGGGGMTVVTTGRGRSSSVSVSGNSSVIVSGGGMVTVNGRVVTGGTVIGSSGITAEVTVPPGTAMAFRSTSADLAVTGPLAELDATTVSGDIEAGVVGVLNAKTTSGDVEVDAVTERAVVGSVSGDVEVGSYGGGYAALNAVSGDLSLSATPSASGSLSASTVSGNIRLRGADHLRPHTSTVSGRVRY